MKKKIEKGRLYGILVSVFQFILIVVAILLVVHHGFDQLPRIYITNISVDVFGMVMGYVLFVCCLIDVQKNGSRYNYFYLLVNVIFIALFTDLCAWLVDGIPDLRMLNVIDNTIYYLTGSFAAFLFWKYVTDFLKADGKVIKIIDRIMLIGLVVAVFMRIINIPTGVYFTVGADGIYARSATFPISLIYTFVSIITGLVLVIVYRKRLQRYQIVALCLYILAPMASNVLTASIYGISLISGVIMMVLLLMYCVLNISQGMDKAVADRDLSMATSIQENMLPRIFPPYPDRGEISLYAYMRPAKEVGGDFYDFFMVDDDHIALVIADVSGKGVPAALFMMVSKVLIQSRMQSGDSPAEALYKVNNQLLNGESNLQMFVTVWLALIDLRTGEGVAANAGHEHPVLKRADGKYEAVKYRHSPAVATIEDAPFKQHEFTLQKGDTIVVYTDGVMEATNINVEQYGMDRLLNALNGAEDENVEAFVKTVVKSVDEFTGEADQFDDITMLVFRYNGLD